MKGDKKVLGFAMVVLGHRRFSELQRSYDRVRPDHESDDDAAAAVLQQLTEAEVALLWRSTKAGAPPKEDT